MNETNPAAMSTSLNVSAQTEATLVEQMYNISNVHNKTNATSGRDEALAKVEIAVLAGILFMAVFGNMLVIAILMYRERKLSRMQLFIIHLAAADISVGLFQVLPQLMMDITYRFDGNNFLCKLVMYMQVATMYSSTYVLIMTAVDRYMSICHPLMSQTWTSRRVHVMACIAWLISAIFATPQLFIFSYKESDGVNICGDNFDSTNLWPMQTYVTWIFLSVYAIPFTILTACYSKICIVVWISVNAKENHSGNPKKKHLLRNGTSCQLQGTNKVLNPRAHSKKLSKSKIKTVKLTLAVVTCFIVCWAPFFITQMWAAYDISSPYYTSHVMAITLLLASLNSCTNPWIYLAFSSRLCNRRQPMNSTKTWLSTANTYVTDAGNDTLRMRNMHKESRSLSGT
ncbi:annetocin receptor-like [Dreissena polymorpha]|uniref:G-protein coupled receptors family 1 profile domain-containing protein n=1 Tax=Dreissena polymorpha TaxID=45954 RepID=A0A9D4DMF5_DREPO|nr:annetocin receptor-like [Dreissena polymorpha]KAH3751971.1 hypothetical protein DPMN_186579 [Dreissena polymorpha]